MFNFAIIKFMVSSEAVYYELLGVEPSASISEVKRAFRKRVKVLHPDTASGEVLKAGVSLNKGMVQLVEAYKYLIAVHKGTDEFSFSKFQKKGRLQEFDYRSWLAGQSDYESRTKLILFDLFHDFENVAVEEYLRLRGLNDNYTLSNFLERHDFMDCGFVLAEELFFRGHFFQAFELLIPVIEMEIELPYFKHFFPEVLRLARTILIGKLNRVCTPDDIIEFYRFALNWDFSKNDKARFSKYIAEAYYDLGDTMMANFYVEKMSVFVPRMRKPNWMKQTTCSTGL